MFQEENMLQRLDLLTVLFVVVAVLGLPWRNAEAQTMQEYTSTPAFQGDESPEQALGSGEAASPHERMRRRARELGEKAEQQVSDLAEYASGMLEDLAEPRAQGWFVFGIGTLIGIVSLMGGWTIIQSLLIPFAPVWGLLTGGVTAFCLIESFYTNRPTWFRVTLFAVGVTAGLGLYLFAALRARPVAIFLVVLSPFLIFAAFFFDYNTVLGVIAFVLGFLAGFAAMLHVRPLAIFSTALLGAGVLMACWGLLGKLLGEKTPFLVDSFAWLCGAPLMLLLALGMLTFIGLNFQFTTGPKGTLSE